MSENIKYSTPEGKQKTFEKFIELDRNFQIKVLKLLLKNNVYPVLNDLIRESNPFITSVEFYSLFFQHYSPELFAAVVTKTNEFEWNIVQYHIALDSLSENPSHLARYSVSERFGCVLDILTYNNDLNDKIIPKKTRFTLDEKIYMKNVRTKFYKAFRKTLSPTIHLLTSIKL